jgi:hypothetical protein
MGNRVDMREYGTFLTHSTYAVTLVSTVKDRSASLAKYSVVKLQAILPYPLLLLTACANGTDPVER